MLHLAWTTIPEVSFQEPTMTQPCLAVALCSIHRQINLQTQSLQLHVCSMNGVLMKEEVLSQGSKEVEINKAILHSGWFNHTCGQSQSGQSSIHNLHPDKGPLFIVASV